MIEIFNIDDSYKWDEIVRSFSQYDVYYLSGYVKAFSIHGDGEPQLLYYTSPSLKAIYVFMKRATFVDGIFDSITPYGYGGVLFEGDVTDSALEEFWHVYVAKMKELNIISSFVRYHPIINNVANVRVITDVISLGKTISIDLTSTDIIWGNIISKNKNMIRKAEKNGVEILHGKEWSLFEKFIDIYNSTMIKDNASDYYFFNETFYKSIYDDLYDNFEMFYAKYQGKIIAMSIIIFANNQMHYHLSGSRIEYRNIAPTNLLLYKAALWGHNKGYKTFHLGGGVGSKEDNLFKFKASFNRNSDCHFSISKNIFDIEKYNELVEIRASMDECFNRESNYFPLYRSEK